MKTEKLEVATPVFPKMRKSEAAKLLMSDSKLRDWVKAGQFVFAGGYFVVAKPDYVTFLEEKPCLTEKAKEHLSSCVLQFSEKFEPVTINYCSNDPELTSHEVTVRTLLFHPDAQGAVLKANIPHKEVVESLRKEIFEKSMDKALQDTLLTMLGNPTRTLCDCLMCLMDDKKWSDPATFEECTCIERDYYGKIKRNKANKMRRKTLMTICIALGLSSRWIVKLFEKAGYVLQWNEEPWKIYVDIIDLIPGIPIDFINDVLDQQNALTRGKGKPIPLLGTPSLVEDALADLETMEEMIQMGTVVRKDDIE